MQFHGVPEDVYMMMLWRVLEVLKKRDKKKKNWVNYHLYNRGLAFCEVSLAPSTSRQLFNSMIHIKATPAAKLKVQTAHLHSDALITIPL